MGFWYFEKAWFDKPFCLNAIFLNIAFLYFQIFTVEIVFNLEKGFLKK